jgi:hypothetical protein
MPQKVQNTSTVKPLNSNQTNPKVPKGLGIIKDSIQKFDNSSILYDIAHAFGKIEKTGLEHQKIQSTQMQTLTRLIKKNNEEVSAILTHLSNEKKITHLFNAARKLATSLSLSLNIFIGLELLTVGAPITGGVFLAAATLSGAELSGYFEKHQKYLDGLNIASTIASIGVGKYAGALTDISQNVLKSAFILLSNAIQAGNSFNQQRQKNYESQYLSSQIIEKKLEFSLNGIVNAFKRSFDESDKIEESVKHQLLVNYNLDS